MEIILLGGSVAIFLLLEGCWGIAVAKREDVVDQDGTGLGIPIIIIEPNRPRLPVPPHNTL